MKQKHDEQHLLRIAYRVMSVVVCLTLITVLLVVVARMPRFGNDQDPTENEVYRRYVENGMSEAGAVNTVADMILDYRAFDTLGESNVLFTAACIVLILLRADRDPKNGEDLIPELRTEPPCGKKDSILRASAAVLLAAGTLYGIFIILNGHLSAGGGFSGGAVAGAALVLFAMAYGPERIERTLNQKAWNRIIWAALMVYTLLKTYSFYTGANGIESVIPLGIPGTILSGGMILPLNICVGIVVACVMYAFYALFSKGGLGDGK